MPAVGGSLYVNGRLALDAQWCSLHPGEVGESAKDAAHYGLYRQQVRFMRQKASWVLGQYVADEGWLCAYAGKPCAQVVVRFPLFWVGALLLVYPVVAFGRGLTRRALRRWRGLCLKCGYNLTGNVSGVCPECGEDV